jgi:mRNA-degrading endonuclease RelE of RelBE toxin-antitoxin system
MRKVVIHSQAEAFVRALAPEPRRRQVAAMKALPRGDILALEGRLAGYWRLRSGGYRILYADSVRDGIRVFDCLFAERRPIVYDLFEQILAEQALERGA